MQFRTLHPLCFLGIVWLCASCSGSDPESQSQPSLTLRAPDILTPRAVNYSNLVLELQIGGQLITSPGPNAQNEDYWSFDVEFVPNQATFISLTWYELFQRKRRLDLATWQETIAVNYDGVYRIDPTKYETEEFDNDNDGATNLEELIASTHPFDDLSFPGALPLDIDVIIPRIPLDTNSKPQIDGSYDEFQYEGQSAQFNDINGNALSIDNLMIDDGVLPERKNGDTEMRWFAMHDTNFLYIFVEGEKVALSDPQNDSTEYWNDDNLTIYLDGNNSKGSIYDNVDDIRIQIPLLGKDRKRNVSNSANTRFSVSSTSAIGTNVPSPINLDVEFAVCRCDRGGQHTWEVKIPMAQAGLRNGKSFGIDLHIDLDHDGGRRDVRWGWFHPPGADETWRNPSLMATGYIQ